MPSMSLAEISRNLILGVIRRIRQDDIGLLVASGGFLRSRASARPATTSASNQPPKPPATKTQCTYDRAMHTRFKALPNPPVESKDTAMTAFAEKLPRKWCANQRLDGTMSKALATGSMSSDLCPAVEMSLLNCNLRGLPGEAVDPRKSRWVGIPSAASQASGDGIGHARGLRFVGEVTNA